MRLSDPIPLQTLAGAIAGMIVTVAFLASPLISPLVFYGWYVLAGAIYGAAAGLAVRALLPSFNISDIVRMSAVVAAGFFATIFIAITLNQQIIVSVAYTAFVLPPSIAMICGAIARQLIVQAGKFRQDGGRPGFFWGALAFAPGFWFFGLVIGASTAWVAPSVASTSMPFLSFIPGLLAGGLGGWLSGSLLTRRIRTAFADEQAPAAVAQFTWETAGEKLTVVDAPKEKAKGVPKTQPVPSLGLPLRTIAATGGVTFLAAWLIFSTLPTLPQLGIVSPPFVPPQPTYSGTIPTPLPLPEPRYGINEKVQVFNLDPSLELYTNWWVNSYTWTGSTWVYQVRTDDGITINRTEAQLAPLGEPTPIRVTGLYSRQRWDWQMPLTLSANTDTIPDGTLVHLQSEVVNGGQVEYLVRDFIGRVATVDEHQLLPPEESYHNPEDHDGMPLFGTAQGRIRLAETLGPYATGTHVQIQNAYFDTRTNEWFYNVRMPDGSSMPVRESDLTSIGLQS